MGSDLVPIAHDTHFVDITGETSGGAMVPIIFILLV
jgi:hypothetical protein